MSAQPKEQSTGFTEALENLIDRAEEMDNHFGYLMEGLKTGGSAWNAADARRADMYAALHRARAALAAAPLMYEALKAAFTELDNRYDVDTLSDGAGGGTHREYPFGGAGALMERISAALAAAGGPR